MPTTLTLKNIPDEVYDRLKASAESHRRSLNMEAILCLEQALGPAKISVEERLARLHKIHATLGPITVTAAEIDVFKKKGRK